MKIIIAMIAVSTEGVALGNITIPAKAEFANSLANLASTKFRAKSGSSIFLNAKMI